MQTSLKPVENCLETGGVTIPFDAAIITPAIKHAIESGYFEAEEAQQLPHIVEPDDRVLDIGAGIGFISTLIARRAKYVISVEANPDLIPYMAGLHRLNGVENVERLNVVLGESDTGLARFYQRKDFWMGSLSKGPNPYISMIKVPKMALGPLLKREHISLIVCDIEGAESVLFKSVDLGEVSRIYLELHDHITGLKGVSAVFETMAAHGFSYDPRYSSGAIVLFRKVAANEKLRPYARG